MADLTVANTILTQLGGSRFTTMTGAHTFTGSPSLLTFRLPGGAGRVKKGINAVRIHLTTWDTYDVEFLRIRGVNSTVIAYKENIYADQLQAVFTRETGLDTSLGGGR